MSLCPFTQLHRNIYFYFTLNLSRHNVTICCSSFVHPPHTINQAMFSKKAAAVLTGFGTLLWTASNNRASAKESLNRVPKEEEKSTIIRVLAITRHGHRTPVRSIPGTTHDEWNDTWYYLLSHKFNI